MGKEQTNEEITQTVGALLKFLQGTPYTVLASELEVSLDALRRRVHHFKTQYPDAYKKVQQKAYGISQTKKGFRIPSGTKEKMVHMVGGGHTHKEIAEAFGLPFGYIRRRPAKAAMLGGAADVKRERIIFNV